MTRIGWLCILLALAFVAAGVTSIVLMSSGGRGKASIRTNDVAPAPSDAAADIVTPVEPLPSPATSSAPTPVPTPTPASSGAPADAVVAPITITPPKLPAPTVMPSVAHLAFTPDARLITVLSDGTTWYRDLVSGARQEIGAKLEGVSAMAFTPDGKGIVTIDGAGELKFLDGGTWRTNETIRTGIAGVKDVAFSPDGRSVALAGSGVVVFDVHDRKATRTLHSGRPCTSVSYSADGRQLLTASPVGATFWETTFWRSEATVAGNDTVAARFWPGRAVFVTLTAEGTIRIYDQVPRRVQTTRLGRDGSVSQFALSPDGRTVATYGSTGLMLWDAGSSVERKLQ